jgi:hypothetical protein
LHQLISHRVGVAVRLAQDVAHCLRVHCSHM